MTTGDIAREQPVASGSGGGPAAAPSVLLSYARGDDDEFVEHTYAVLSSRGFDLWWDRESMPNRALTFTEEIRDAIHHSERLVVVIGPRALRSDYVRAEWQAALSEQKPVIPLLRRLPQGVGARSQLPGRAGCQ